MKNLAQLILDRAERRPEALFGVVEQPIMLADVVAIARESVSKFAAGLVTGTRVAVIGSTSTSYLLAWITLQLAGVETAMIALQRFYASFLLTQANIAQVGVERADQPTTTFQANRMNPRALAAMVYLGTALDIADAAKASTGASPTGQHQPPESQVWRDVQCLQCLVEVFFGFERMIRAQVRVARPDARVGGRLGISCGIESRRCPGKVQRAGFVVAGVERLEGSLAKLGTAFGERGVRAKQQWPAERKHQA